jgi:hypothetical protein
MARPAPAAYFALFKSPKQASFRCCFIRDFIPFNGNLVFAVIVDSGLKGILARAFASSA